MSEASTRSAGGDRWERWGRWLLAQRPDPPVSPWLLALQATVFVLAGALAGMAAVFATQGVVRDFTVAWTWSVADARVVEVRAAGRGPRSEYLFDLRLEVDDAGPPPIRGSTVRPVAVRKSWSAPLQPPAAGDRVAVYLDPAAPGRMMPAEAIGTRWLALVLLPLLCGCAVFSLARAATRTTTLLRKRSQGSPGA